MIFTADERGVIRIPIACADALGACVGSVRVSAVNGRRLEPDETVELPLERLQALLAGISPGLLPLTVYQGE